MSDLDELVSTVIGHPEVDSICLENCLGEGLDGIRVMNLLLSSDKGIYGLTEIFLQGLGIRTLGDTTLPDFIASSHTISELKLERNNLNDEDAKLIARALRQNRSLTELSLCGNDITSVGLTALTEAVCDMTSFETLFVSSVKPSL